jgi:hypothetical protein
VSLPQPPHSLSPLSLSLTVSPCFVLPLAILQLLHTSVTNCVSLLSEMTLSFCVSVLALAVSVHAHTGFWARGMYCLAVCSFSFLFIPGPFAIMPQSVRTFDLCRWFECRVLMAQMIRTAMLSSNPCSNCLSTNGGVSLFHLVSLVGSSVGADIRN